jgi:superfamily II DNA/RNA helicase
LDFEKLFQKFKLNDVCKVFEELMMYTFGSEEVKSTYNTSNISKLNETSTKIIDRFNEVYYLRLRFYCKNFKILIVEFSCFNDDQETSSELIQIKRPLNYRDFSTLLNLVRGHKPSFMFTRIISIKNMFRRFDVTKEISDCSSMLIDGYSLILECFKNNQIDWSSGGQFLHLIYLIEKYIEMFANLTDFYFIVFFFDINVLFMQDNQLYLAVTIVLSHLTSIDQIKNKVKFFKSVSDVTYKEFLDQEKPTFLIVNDEFKMEKLNNTELKDVYGIINIFHCSLEIKLMLINELCMKSNRLNAFYSSRSNPKNEVYFKILKNLRYNDDFKCLEGIKNEKWKKFEKNLIKTSKSDLINLKSKIGSKLTYYCVSMIWYYISIDKTQLEESSYGVILFALIIHCYLQNELDLRTRAIRFLPNSEFDKSNLAPFKNENILKFLDIFQSGLANSIGSKNLNFLGLENKESCDIFDGRLFKLSLLICCSAKSYLNFEAIFLHTNKKTINETLNFLTNELIKLDFSVKNSDFLKLIDIGTKSALSEELKILFDNILKSSSLFVKEEDINKLCFKEKDKIESNQLITSKHPLHVSLLKEIECSEINLDDRLEYAKIVEEFKRKYKWFDSFMNKKARIKNEILFNEELETNIQDLSQNSLNQSKPEIDLELIKNAFKNFDIKEALKQMKNSNETKHTVCDILTWLFSLHKSKNLKQKSIKKLEKLSIIIFEKADQLWKLILNEKSSIKTELLLIIQILDYFNFEKTKNNILNYAKKNLSIHLSQSDYENTNMKFKLSETENRFQLKYLSDILKKENQSSNDRRTQLFTPDHWQVEFLNAIDNQESVLITAPTSSGKTFASFYAMEKMLNSQDIDSVLIYVSPTKALVNQTRYSIIERFQNTKIQKNKKLCGIFTRDTRLNLFDCKILVTVPQCLLILATNHAHSNWIKCVKYIVFDEIHSMGGEEQTDVWEQLILLINTPIIALSATISNSKKIYDWLLSLQKYRFQDTDRRKKIRLIQYTERQSDLKRLIYTNKGFKPINPIGFLNVSNVKNHQSLPNDLSLSAAETVELFDSLNLVYEENLLAQFDIETNAHLNSKLTESLFITKSSVKKYQNELLNLFQDLVLSGSSKKAIRVIQQLEPKFEDDEVYPSMKNLVSKTEQTEIIKNIHHKAFLDLIQDLLNEDMLPCIVFTNNRMICELYAKLIVDYLTDNKINLNTNNNSNNINSVKFEIMKDFAEMLNSSVAYHHSGLDPHLKILVENLFRNGKIKIILATATLALGVNYFKIYLFYFFNLFYYLKKVHMPCRTVVFMVYINLFLYFVFIIISGN